MLRELIVRMLDGNGYTVLSADKPSMGLHVARSYAGPIHLVLTDVIMPGMNGRARIEQLARIRPDTRTLFTSAHTEDIIDLTVNC
jgi:two-component system, cell cycle sensor histidine kinase and response regulator CckA